MNEASDYLASLSDFVCAARREQLPPAVVDRARWVIADSLREMSSRKSQTESAGRPHQSPKPIVRAVGLGESRQSQLEADMALTPEQRVIEAERTLMRSSRSDKPRFNRVISFESYEGFLDWDRNERIRR